MEKDLGVVCVLGQAMSRSHFDTALSGMFSISASFFASFLFLCGVRFTGAISKYRGAMDIDTLLHCVGRDFLVSAKKICRSGCPRQKRPQRCHDDAQRAWRGHGEGGSAAG